MHSMFLCRGFLEVSSMDSNQLVTLSFPPPYLGDKRTAFGQSLTLTLSFPALPGKLSNSSSHESVHAILEVISYITSASPLERLLIDLSIDYTEEPQQTKVVDLWQACRTNSIKSISFTSLLFKHSFFTLHFLFFTAHCLFTFPLHPYLPVHLIHRLGTSLLSFPSTSSMPSHTSLLFHLLS